jgi:peptidoglycan hydrolase-like protein with peptidoglycan-binding domain
LRSSGFFQTALAVACALLLGGFCHLRAEAAKGSSSTHASSPTPASSPTHASAQARTKNSPHSKASKHATTAHRRSSRHHRTRRASRRRGQQRIDSQRASEIQEALIREHYLKGEPTGRWDAATQDAMERYQADNGWQTKVTPDARALIKLGLGPDHEHLLNPETAMTSGLEKDQATDPATEPAPGSPSTSKTAPSDKVPPSGAEPQK